MKKITTIALFLSMISLSSFAQQGISFQHEPWAEIVAKAKGENKLIFLDAYTSWCGPCKLLQANVFPNAELGAYFNEHFINTKIDMEKGEGPAMARKYPVKGYPTLLFIDPHSEKIVQKVLGYRNIVQLMKIGESAVTKATTAEPAVASTK